MSKLRVLYVIPDGADLGGIYNSSENLICGLRELGHEVLPVLIKPSQSHRDNPIGDPLPGSSVGEGTGWPLHPIRGWKAPYFSWGDDDSLDTFVELGNAHDVVIWAALFGLRNDRTEGHARWTRVFSKVKRPHVAMIRDDHLEERYPWVAALEPWITGWAGVQQVSLDSCSGLRRPRALVYSGHRLDDAPKVLLPKSKRWRNVASFQTFKNWKRVDRLVAAAPYLKRQHRVDVMLGGDGIERYYMSSKDKVKPRYICTAESDPEAKRDRLGKPIWGNALRYGMQFLGPTSPTDRDRLLSKSGFFVDLSYREHSSGQINRTVVEAIKQGCVPFAVDQFISGHPAGQGKLFKTGVHYLSVAPHCHPSELAYRLASGFELSDSAYREMQHAGRELIQQFGRRESARRLIILATEPKHRGSWMFGGTADQHLLKRGREMFVEIFKELP